VNKVTVQRLLDKLVMKQALEQKMRKNLILLCLIRGLLMTLFPVAIITLFWKYQMGMSMTQIMVLQAIFGIIVALFEFGGGYVADRIGYRRSLMFGLTTMALGWSIYVVSEHFYQAVMAEVIIAIGVTFVSGTDRALIYESLRSINQEHLYTKWVGRSVFTGQFAEGSAALIAGAIYAYWSRLPFILEVVALGTAAVLAFFLTERLHQHDDQQGHFESIKAIFSLVFVQLPTLRWVMLLACTLGLSSFYPVWLISLYAKDSGVDTLYLGLLWALANYLVAFGALMSHQIERTFTLNVVIFGCIVMVLMGYTGLALSNAWWGFAFYYLLTLMRGINGPILEHQINQQIPPHHRSAILSIKSLVIRGVFACTGPLIGILVDQQGFHRAFMVLGVMIGALLIVLMILRYRSARAIASS